LPGKGKEDGNIKPALKRISIIMSKSYHHSIHSQRMLRAINFNNIAISEMKLGKYKQSILQFSSALKCLKRMMPKELLLASMLRLATSATIWIVTCQVFSAVTAAAIE
jgi:hypothetical protein